MLMATTVIAICLSFPIQQIRAKTAAVQLIEQFGGAVTYDYQWSPSEEWIAESSPPGQAWLKQMLGENYRANVVEVQLFRENGANPAAFGDDQLKALGALTELRWLVLMDTGVTDQGLKHIRHLKKLERLDLEGSKVTKQGAEELKKALPDVRIYIAEPDMP
jgi:hypothetical protein